MARQAHDPKKHVLDLIGDGHRFPAFAKPASAGEARSEKIMRQKDLHAGAVVSLPAGSGFFKPKTGS